MIRACVAGWPVAHSRSPLIHGYWLRRYGIGGAYAREAVPPEEARRFFAALPESGYTGCNVTLPHKETAFAVAAERDGAAAAVGAANTLWLEAGRICATNTDTYGFMTHLALSAPGWASRDAPVSVLGAGGAARAIVYGFLEAGVEKVRLFNRTRERAERLAALFGPRVRAFGWEERERLCRDSAVVVNTTTMGMGGREGVPLDAGLLHPDCVVADIVYVPLETEFLRKARRRGLAAVDGLGMLLHQAVPGFEKWFGVRPEVTRELYLLAAADIAGGPC